MSILDDISSFFPNEIPPAGQRKVSWWKVSGTYTAMYDTGNQISVLTNSEVMPVVSSHICHQVELVVEGYYLEEVVTRAKAIFPDLSVSSAERFFGYVVTRPEAI